jgi:dihydroorotase
MNGESMRVVGDDRVVRLDGGRLVPSTGPAGDLYIGPGWVDLHTHVYDGMTSLSVPPDRVGLDAGVHVVADAGSAGSATIDGLVKYVRPTARTQMRAWLNIGSHGLVDLVETAQRRLIDVEATLAAVDRHREFICGIKVRSSALIVGEMGIVPLQLGARVARARGLPLLVHIGEGPPPIDDVLDLLEPGDVITHCYHGKRDNTPWEPDGRPNPALARAIRRGVLLDVGHGAASFDFGMAERAIAAGFPPNSISTDIHIRNIDGPVHSLATTMTKSVACGMSLENAISAVTDAPRRVLRMADPWISGDGTVKHATVFRFARTEREFVDANGGRRTVEREFIPVDTVRS